MTTILVLPLTATVLARLVFINFCLTIAVRGLSTFLPVYMANLSIPVTSISGGFGMSFSFTSGGQKRT